MSERVVDEAMAFADNPGDVAARARLFLWLLATERLRLRFAFARHVVEAGDYHEKMGVFELGEREAVAFTGSANESLRGHQANFESVDVFRSWRSGEAARVETKRAQFVEMWEGRAAGLDVVALSRSILEKVRTRAPSEWEPGWIEDSEEEEELPRPPLWRHQREAREAFHDRKQGILEMATGTGKTRTAIEICRDLLLKGAIQTVIVATDGNDLLDQWSRDLFLLSDQHDSPLPVYRSYGARHQTDLFLLEPRGSVLLCSRANLGSALKGLPDTVLRSTLLIHDEVHALGSPANRRNLEGLADPIPFRLGLSATPEREYDEEGTAFILDHIGPVIYEFGLEDAIKDSILTPFDYVPLYYEVTQDDRDRLQQVYKRAAARKAEGRPMTKEEIWIALARVHKTSRAKLGPFERYIRQNPSVLSRCIVFVETMAYGREVLRLIHDYRHDFHSYFSGEDKEVLLAFAEGSVECLVTCHRLSQGIDIQSLENVILFASARSRLETIQRIGRCLRKHPRLPSKKATVVDFIRVSAAERDAGTSDESRAEWLASLAGINPLKE